MVNVKIANPLRIDKFINIDLLVDSETIFTSIPRRLLEELELSPIDKEKLKVYGGTIVEQDIGWVLIEYNKKRRVVPVIFGEESDTPILGATSLEALGYQIEHVTKKLKTIEFLMI